jgi:hypothetical protein
VEEPDPEPELGFVFAGGGVFGAGGLGGDGSLCGALRYISGASVSAEVVCVLVEALAAFVFFGVEAPA